MPIKKYKPMTPGRRGMTTLAKDEITTSKPEKSFTSSATPSAFTKFLRTFKLGWETLYSPKTVISVAGAFSGSVGVLKFTLTAFIRSKKLRCMVDVSAMPRT